MKLGLCAEDAVTHNLAVVWTGLDAGELKEGEQLEIQVAGHTGLRSCWSEILTVDGAGGTWRADGCCGVPMRPLSE